MFKKVFNYNSYYLNGLTGKIYKQKTGQVEFAEKEKNFFFFFLISISHFKTEKWASVISTIYTSFINFYFYFKSEFIETHKTMYLLTSEHYFLVPFKSFCTEVNIIVMFICLLYQKR